MSERSRNKIIIGLGIVLVIIICIWGFYGPDIRDQEYSYITDDKDKEPQTINDIAYDVNEEYGYTIYIEEETGYQPYLVLTNNYEDTGNVLLLREHVLDEQQPYNDPEGETAYYKNSYIDRYLEDIYWETISESIQKKILESRILILNGATYSAIKDGAEAENIKRKVFLLSFAEVSHIAEERDILDGKLLKYFEQERESLMATSSNEIPTVWMLRSPSLVYTTNSIVVTPENKVGFGSVERLKGIRPAFCLSGDLEIELSDQIEENKIVYILSE